MQRETLNSNGGFTLIEAMVAMAILSVGILTLYTMQITGIKGNSKANVITVSSNAVRDQIETLLGRDFTDSDFSTGTHTVSGTPPIQAVNWTVTDWRSDGISNDGDVDVDEFDERGVKDVQLTVQYTERGVTKTTVVQFLKTEIF